MPEPARDPVAQVHDRPEDPLGVPRFAVEEERVERGGRLPCGGGGVPLSSKPLLVLLLAAAGSFTLGYLWTEDVWWYLASGDLILERGALPERDPFVYSIPGGAPWLAHSWLWTVLLAYLHQVFGLAALPVLSTLLVGAIAALVYTSARLDRFGLTNTLVTALVVYAVVHRALRAEIAGWLLLVVYVRVLERRPFTWRAALGLAVLQGLWANLHAGYVVGILVALAYGVGDRLRP